MLINLPAKRPRCSVFGGTADGLGAEDDVEIVALGAPKKLEALPEASAIVRPNDDKRKSVELVWKIARVSGERWLVLPGGRARKHPAAYIYDTCRLRLHDFEKDGCGGETNKRRELLAAAAAQETGDDFAIPKDLDDVNEIAGRHRGRPCRIDPNHPFRGSPGVFVA